MMIFICGLDPLRCVQPTFAAARNHVHENQIHGKAQAVYVRQRGIVDGQRHLKALRSLNPQFKQLAGHGLILDNHDFVFHGIPCLPSKNVSVSSKRGA